MKWRKGCLPVIGALYVIGISAARGDEAVVFATWKGGTITEQQLERKLGFVPRDIMQRIASDAEGLPWLINQVRDMVAQIELARRAEQKGLLDDDPGLRGRLLAQENEFLVQALRGRIQQEYGPSEDELRRAYEIRRDAFRIPEAAWFRYIFTNAENGGEKAARNRIDEAHALIESGSDFAVVAEIYSETGAPPAERGNRVRAPLDDMNPAIAKALRDLKKGEYSAPFKTRYGFHIVLLEEYDPERQESFEEVKDRIAAILMGQFTQGRIEEIEREARERFPVELDVDLLESASPRPDAALIRCGTWTIPLGALDDLENRGERQRKAEKWAADFPLAAYARDLGIHADPEVRDRLEQTKVDLLGEAMQKSMLKERLPSPTSEELQAYYEQYRDRVRSLPRTAGGSMQFKPVSAVGADQRTRYEASMEAKKRAELVRSRFEKGETFETLAAGLEEPDEARTFPLGESHGALFDVHTAELNPGEMSAPVEWAEAWHLFYLSDREPGKPLSFEEGHDMVLEHFLADREAALKRELVLEIGSELGLEIHEQALSGYLGRFVEPSSGKP